MKGPAKALAKVLAKVQAKIMVKMPVKMPVEGLQVMKKKGRMTKGMPEKKQISTGD